MNRSSFFKVFSASVFAFFWIAAIFLSILLIFWEIQSVQNTIIIQPLLSQVIPVSCEADISNESKIVHIDCPLNKLTTFHPPVEFSWNLKPFQGVFFEMRVEMYQWMLKPQILGYSIKQVNTSSFPYIFYNNYVNPDYIPQINGSGRRYAPHVYAGTYRLNKEYLVKFNKKKQLSLVDDGYYVPCAEHPPISINYATTQVYKDALYTGNPAQPKIGDFKITFWGSTATHVSVIAQQSRNKLSRVTELHSVKGLPNRSVPYLIYEGDYTPRQMFNLFHKHNTGNRIFIWMFRIFTVSILSTAISLTYMCFESFSKIAIMPFILGSIFTSTGSILIIVSIIWLYFHLTYSAIVLLLGILSVVSGRFLWAYGQNFTATFFKDLEFTQASSQSIPLMPDNEDHFYQPI